MSDKKKVEIIEVWDCKGEFVSELQSFINQENIEVIDIQYSPVYTDEECATGYTAMIIYVEKQSD